MDFLGVVLELKDVKMEEAKAMAVLDWLVPKLVKDIQKFLGLANYYRRFIEGFVKIVRLLSVKSTKEPCIRINTKELDRVSSTKYLSYIH